MNDTKLTFRLKVSEPELEKLVLAHLVADNQIGNKEAKCFKGLSRQGRATFAEFYVGESENKET